jgi:uncharacterized SAM-binding protein YcdF (DUF218 family)
VPSVSMAKLVFQIRKLLPALLMPLSLALVLLLFGVFRRRRAIALTGITLLWIASLPAVSFGLAFILESQYPHLVPEQCPKADAIVALGGIAGEMKRFPGQIEWEESVDRFEMAVKLYRMQKAPVIVFTRARWPTDDREITEGDLLRRAAIDHGVPDEAIRLTRTVATTVDEAEAVKDYLMHNNSKRVILVTSAYHMSRAAFLFRRAKVDFAPFPVDYHADLWEWKFDNFVPKSSALAETEKSLREVYGILYYRITSLRASN